MRPPAILTAALSAAEMDTAFRLPIVRLAHAAVPSLLLGRQLGRLGRQGRGRPDTRKGENQGQALDLCRPVTHRTHHPT